MKVSHVGVVMVWPELIFSMYKMLFFARGRDAKRLRAELTLAQCSMDIILSKFTTRPMLGRNTSTATGRIQVIRLVCAYFQLNIFTDLHVNALTLIRSHALMAANVASTCICVGRVVEGQESLTLPPQSSLQLWDQFLLDGRFVLQ